MMGPIHRTFTQVVVTCPCGMIPLGLAAHDDSQAAWKFASEHVSLNPTKCRPQMTKVEVTL